MTTQNHLKNECERLDGKGYGAYKDLRGEYDLGECRVVVDHVQSDPYAPPSKVCVVMDRHRAGLPEELLANRVRHIALEDYLSRSVARVIQAEAGDKDRIEVDVGRQEILERTAVRIDAQTIELRLAVGLPARGRRILGRQAAYLLSALLPRIALRGLVFSGLDEETAFEHVWRAEDQEVLRQRIGELGCVGFVGNGARLARSSGVNDAPMQGEEVVPFSSPPELELAVDLPHAGRVYGMGIPAGVTVIVGGGYHGKSTLLRALERGVYNHVPGDGRDLVVTEPTAVKIRAEDGRAVRGVDISPFINALPNKQSTRSFATSNASGSTSQAANIMEALEAQSRLLLVDEDTSATNFMIRDSRMQALVAKEQEPITPFLDRIQELYTAFGVSTILVMGGSGDYLSEADTVLKLQTYEASVVTEEARAVMDRFPRQRRREISAPLTRRSSRLVASACLALGPRDKVRSKGTSQVTFGKSSIDLACVEQLLDPSQTRSVAAILRMLPAFLEPNGGQIREAVEEILAQVVKQGVDSLGAKRGRHPGDLAMVRSQEVLAAISRYRRLQLAAEGEGR
ncbi:ABC-ATPase domain-containing protein [Desulfohalobium retbaense]|uniref:ABC transporter, ATPase, predicted n=1 Tax=Desulfohalobium retbaense (strain ATCC 49708 / DSM 5692 / JCM 16813 / HR100) TaxID=485915 RepID=C8X0J6_DESRD|nr:ABC-ATPase domain-containing protein [Desulfohalobium retbaense]ACV67821.1 ABC transporter, ATPase, predicted [Desulfohalobium retbaense DSM 5692]